MNKKQWRKVLYEKQPYPDNYVDPSRFLEELDTKSASISQLSYRSMLLGSSIIVQQLTVVTIFLTFYQLIMMRTVTIRGVVLFDVIFLIVGYTFQIVLSEVQQEFNIFQSLKGGLLFGVFLRIAAPVLQTLTSSFSDDTIHALAIVFSALHLVFHDYAFINCDSDNFSGTISLNAAMFTAVLLASRLHEIEMVFIFILLAVVCFSLFPQTARIVKRRSSALHLLITWLQWIFASFLLWYLDKTLFAIYQLFVAFLILGPLWLIRMQVYKKALKGPWDINHIHS